MAYNDIEWLPNLVLFYDYQGDWNKYLEAIYNYFRQDFIINRPIFRGVELGLKRYPISNNKESTFWHMISEGNVEENRNPDFRRCERIRWPKSIIENSTNSEIKVWENERKGETRILLWFVKVDYLVVLAKRKREDLSEFILPWTAYTVIENHQRKKLLKEYNNYKKANAAQY